MPGRGAEFEGFRPEAVICRLFPLISAWLRKLFFASRARVSFPPKAVTKATVCASFRRHPSPSVASWRKSFYFFSGDSRRGAGTARPTALRGGDGCETYKCVQKTR